MTNNEHENSYSAHDMTTASADGFRNAYAAMIGALNLAREFASGFHGMSRNNAENLADELLDVLNAAISDSGAAVPNEAAGYPSDWAGFGDMWRAALAAVPAAQPAAAGELPEPVGVAGTMPGTGGFTMAAFKAEDVPVGTRLYARAAVDLGPAREVFRRWHANELNSTDAMLALAEAMAVLDSQAVGNG